MLEIRLNCEHCDNPLPNDSEEAFICSYECTYCRNCIENVLQNVCPNCGGGFEKRPTRPYKQLEKYPPRQDKVLNPVTDHKYLKRYKDINPRKR